MCTPDCFFQRFIVNGKRFREYTDKWKRKVEQYYANIHDRKTQEVEEGSTTGEDNTGV